MKVSNYAHQQMKYLGVGGEIPGSLQVREIVHNVYGVNIDEYDVVGPVYEVEGDYQPVVTGKAKVGEATETAMRREIREELGLDNVTLIPLPACDRFPKWTFAVAIDGREYSSNEKKDLRRDDYNRRIMVLVLLKRSENLNLIPVNDEGIHEVIRIPAQFVL